MSATMTGKRHDQFLACRHHVMAAVEPVLVRSPTSRGGYDDWVAEIHSAAAAAANEWARAHCDCRTVTVEQVGRVECRAMGHSDYHSKFGLYVAELVYGVGGVS